MKSAVPQGAFFWTPGRDPAKGRPGLAGHHPVGHGQSAPTTPGGWIDYWTGYYNKSAQLKRASQESWNATREIWKRKLVQAKRIRCQKCIEIVKLWLRTYGYGPERRPCPSAARQEEQPSRLSHFSRVSHSPRNPSLGQREGLGPPDTPIPAQQTIATFSRNLFLVPW